MEMGEDQVVLVRRWPRARPVVWLAVGGLRRNEERREEAADGSGPVVARLDDGRVDVGARVSRLEEETDETCDVGAVELCVMEAPCEVVGRLDVWVMVVLCSMLPGGGRATGSSGCFGNFSSLRFPRAFSEGFVGEVCSCALLKLASDDFEGESLAVKAISLCCT